MIQWLLSFWLMINQKFLGMLDR